MRNCAAAAGELSTFARENFREPNGRTFVASSSSSCAVRKLRRSFVRSFARSLARKAKQFAPTLFVVIDQREPIDCNRALSATAKCLFAPCVRCNGAAMARHRRRRHRQLVHTPRDAPAPPLKNAPLFHSSFSSAPFVFPIRPHIGRPSFTHNLQEQKLITKRYNAKMATTTAAAAAAHVLLCVVTILVTISATSRALENKLARTPPMGWLAWERFTCQVDCERYPKDCINTQLFKEMADRLVDDQWLAAGYEYVHIDDCWSERERESSSGKLVPDLKRFKEGIRSLAEYVHRRGAKLGIYGDCGTKTCAGYPGQLRHNDSLRTLYKPLPAPTSMSIAPAAAAPASPAEVTHDDEDDMNHDYVINESTYFQLDAQTLADWHVDSLKFDGCYVDPLRAGQICSKMAPALAQSGRPILLICEWPFYEMYTHTNTNFTLAGDSCNVWRYYDDIEDSWLSILNTIDYTVKHQSTIVKYHGPGHWFDPDQLVVGNFGLSLAQARAHFAIWSIWAAPLYMSNDLRNMKPEMAAVLKNKHLIGVDQDELGVFGQMVAQSAEGKLQAFVKPVLPVHAGCPSFAIVYLNRATLGNRQKVSFKLIDDLLATAPIRQAASNQERVRAWAAAEAANNQDQVEHLFNARPQRGSSESDPLASEDDDEEETLNDTLINSGACLERLRAHGAKFQVLDLYGDSLSKNVILGNEPLELLVSPSGVRAVKLVEFV